MQGLSFPKAKGKHAFETMVTAEKFMKEGAKPRPKSVTNVLFVYSDRSMACPVRSLGLKHTDLPYRGGNFRAYISIDREYWRAGSA